MSDQTITLRPGGIEYIKWTATGLPAEPPVGSVEVSVDGGLTWHAATVTGSEVRLLVAHPDVATPGTAAVAIEGVTEMRVRLTDSPEVVIRGAGRLYARA